MNKYITILLVILTATGSEAQTLTSALVAGGGNIKFEEMLSPEQLRAMGSDIMSVLKLLQSKADNEKDSPHFFNNQFLSGNRAFVCRTAAGNKSVVWPSPKGLKPAFTGSSISIRAPSIILYACLIYIIMYRVKDL